VVADEFRQLQIPKGSRPMRLVFAYLDPVTGSALAQVALGIAAAVSLGYHFLRRRITGLFSRFRSRSTSSPES
jgi:hypothetical protein